MIEIILDASQLEIFEACPRKWYYSYVLNLVSNSSYKPFDVGSYYHEVLAFYYKLLSDPNRIKIDPVMKAINFATTNKLFNKYNIIEKEEQFFHLKRLTTYLNKYEVEDLNMEIIAIEGGFSYLLYEDNNRRYILEGKIDLIARSAPEGTIVIDHKTQSRFDNRFEFNHQVCNYLTFTKADYFVYNYIGLQDKLPTEGLRRVIYKPHPGMLDQWKIEVTKTFDQMYDYISKPIAYNKKEEAFPRHRSACDSSKYGLCQYHKLCSIPDGSLWAPVVLSAYKEKDEVWRPWS